MSGATRWHIVLAGEGSSDRRRVGCLVEDRLAAARRSAVYEQFGVDDYIALKNIKNVHRNEVSQTSGFGGFAGGHTSSDRGDRRNIRLLFQILVKRGLSGRADVAVVWARDADGDPDRHIAADELCRPRPGFGVVLRAVADECSEAWVIAGFPTDTSRQKKVARVRKSMSLPFDPVAHPEQLSHKHPAQRSAKACLSSLIDGEPDTELDCLRRAAAARAINTSACGLRDFCEQLDAWLPTAAG